MRDLETIAIAIETAETGHLVFGTLHTSTAPSTVDRVIDQFPADRQAQIRVMLSESLKGVISQTLLKKKGGGRVAAHEVLIGVPAISNLIREGKTFQIPSIMQTSRKVGMIMLNESLVDLVRRDVVTPDEAYIGPPDADHRQPRLVACGPRRIQIPLDTDPTPFILGVDPVSPPDLEPRIPGGAQYGTGDGRLEHGYEEKGCEEDHQEEGCEEVTRLQDNSGRSWKGPVATPALFFFRRRITPRGSPRGSGR
jgi:hypothetical protein